MIRPVARAMVAGLICGLAVSIPAARSSGLRLTSVVCTPGSYGGGYAVKWAGVPGDAEWISVIVSATEGHAAAVSMSPPKRNRATFPGPHCKHASSVTIEARTPFTTLASHEHRGSL